MSGVLSLAAIVSVPLVLGYYVRKKLRQRGRNPKGLPLPPGPAGVPLLGNAPQILGKNMISVIDNWSKEYGPIVYIELFGNPVIVINSTSVAHDLLENRHQNYNGRPNFIMASTKMQGDMMMPFIHANERFRRVRKFVTTELRPQAVTEHFNPIQTAEVHRLIYAMIREPDEWVSFVARCMGSILTTAVYDKPLSSNKEADSIIKDVIRLNDDLINAIDGGQNYVDFLPFVEYIPGMPYKAFAKSYYELAEKTYKTLMDEAKATLESGRPAKGIAARLLTSEDGSGLDYREQYWALAAFYLAGSDTQSIATQSLVLALSLNPHVLAKAQEEVDRVVGPNRLPTFADEPNLPYIRAMVREVLRWRPTGPTAIPHASIEDDEYNGYFIPGGSMIIPNIWSMQMDPSTFENPEEFNPQRYVDNPNLPFHAFGFGRRACPGRRVGEQTLLLEFATIAWALDIKPKTDPETGKVTELISDRETAYSPVGLLRPLPFVTSITPRSPERTQILMQSVEAADI